jgi:hypothetical protein
VQELAEYLSRRYPATYTIKRGNPADASGWYGLPAIQEITVVPVGKTYKIGEEEPMTLATLLCVSALLVTHAVDIDISN